jgi:hypothetical protein
MRIHLARPIALTTGLVLAAMFVGVAPASAGVPSRLWFVGQTGSGGGSCDTPDFSTIQSAIDGTGPGDTIRVCAGTYTEALWIQGVGHANLALEPDPGATVTIAAPKIGSSGVVVLIGISGASGVRVQGFRWRPRSRPSGCGHIRTYLEASAATDLAILANRVVLPRHPCAMSDGIFFAIGAAGAIRGNTLRDAAYGITSDTVGGGDVAITGNTVRWAAREQANPRFASGFGILARDSGGVDAITVSANSVLGINSAGVRAADTPLLDGGIHVDAANALVSRNTIRDTNIGLEVRNQPGTHVDHNSSLRNRSLDCRTDGNRAAWVANVGRPSRSDPKGLCAIV